MLTRMRSYQILMAHRRASRTRGSLKASLASWLLEPSSERTSEPAQTRNFFRDATREIVSINLRTFDFGRRNFLQPCEKRNITFSFVTNRSSCRRRSRGIDEFLESRIVRGAWPPEWSPVIAARASPVSIGWLTDELKLLPRFSCNIAPAKG